MPTLTVPISSPPPSNDTNPDDNPPSPTAPPYSPITPTMSTSLPSATNPDSNSTTTLNNPYLYAPSAQQPRNLPPLQPPTLAPHPQPPSGSQPPPSSQPFSESDNPDAIALRAAMSILQLQRQQALRDMKTLERQKKAALADPEAFARDVAAGKVKARDGPGVVPAPDYPSDEDDGDVMDMDNGGGREENLATKEQNQFGELPTAQKVVRMPPVNWAKYHIVGESLDKLHEEQRIRPAQGQPLRDDDLRPKERGAESVIARAYDPWKDGLVKKEKGVRTRSGGKKG